MKTLQEFKDKLARKQGFEGWRDWIEKSMEVSGHRHIDEGWHNQVAETYAKALLKEERNKMMKETQLICLDYAYWLEVNSTDDFKYPFDPDRSVINYIKYLDESNGYVDDVEHKVDYFYNETGDYTLTLFDEPIGIIKEEYQADQLKRYFLALVARINFLQQQSKV